jgi:hypothetical protein
MPGQKFKHKVMKKLTDLGGPEFVLDYIGDGGMIKDLCEKTECSRSFLSRMLNNTPEYRAALDEGRRILADKMADDSLTMIDDLGSKEDLTSQDVQLAKERIGVRKWMSALNHPDRFAPKKEEVTINIGQLHLGALKKIKAEMIDVTPVPAAIEGGSTDD